MSSLRHLSHELRNHLHEHPFTMPRMETRPASDRRHDLDALRAFAMLLGIALHVALSFAGGPWMVQDSRTSGVFHVLISAVHGFRMPLFFLVSGFFTALLWRQRGLQAQRLPGGQAGRCGGGHREGRMHGKSFHVVVCQLCSCSARPARSPRQHHSAARNHAALWSSRGTCWK